MIGTPDNALSREAHIQPIQVASGSYVSASELVRAGLRALQERGAAVERWLREEVVPAYDAMQADPKRSIPADQVMTAISAHHAARLKTSKRGA